MIELYFSKNNNKTSQAFGKYYPRVSYKGTMTIHDMAQHMAEHNTPFSEGTIEGILRDFVKCVREMTLNGITVKVDNLAIFKAAVTGNGMYIGKSADGTQGSKNVAGIGNAPKGGYTQENAFNADGTPKAQAAVKSVRLLAQATGDYTRDELNKDAKLKWTDKAQADLAALTAVGGSSSESGSGSGSGNSGSGNSGSGNSGSGNSGSGSGSGSGTGGGTTDNPSDGGGGEG